MQLQEKIPGLSAIDLHFARLMEKLSGAPNPELALAAALISHFRGQGHICLDLPRFSLCPVLDELAEREMALPPVEGWLETLRNSPVVGKPGEFRPMILDDKGRLYLHRYWEYERNVAAKIRERLTPALCDYERLQDGLARFFGKEDGINWQKVAAFTALTKKFCVISGGPGTGKTFTVLKIMALLIEQGGHRATRIALAAPTGKAAARLQETIEKAKGNLAAADAVKTALPTTVSTIHRLLGTIPDSPYFQRDANDPLVVDAVIVDEASMVDLALMSKLIDALPAHARLILLGDKDQLASVEAGAVLGDLCNDAGLNQFSKAFATEYFRTCGESLPASDHPPSRLCDHIVVLQKNYRFGDSSPLFALSREINAGDAPAASHVLQGSDQLCWDPTNRSFDKQFRQLVIDGFREYLSADTAAEALEKFNQFRILAALRYGPFGVNELNERAEAVLHAEGLIDRSRRWYFGRPVMITRNDYNLGLFNGDIGMIAADPENGEPQAFFPGVDGQIRKLLPQRLPEHETVFALTVHKSQGSEFEDVLMVLPEQDSPVLSRELIYTGITRARRKLTLAARQDIFALALSRRSHRNSGLPEQLSAAQTLEH